MEEHQGPPGEEQPGGPEFCAGCVMPAGRQQRSKVRAPAAVYYARARDARGVVRPCVYAECGYGGGRAGPVFGQGEEAVRKVLRTLNTGCDCGRLLHRIRFFEGRRAR